MKGGPSTGTPSQYLAATDWGQPAQTRTGADGRRPVRPARRQAVEAPGHLTTAQARALDIIVARHQPPRGPCLHRDLGDLFQRGQSAMS